MDYDDINISDFKRWALHNGLSETTIYALVKEDLTSEETLSVINEEEVNEIGEKYKLPMAETVMLNHAIKSLTGQFQFEKWAAENELVTRARDALMKEDLNTSDALCTLDEDDILNLVKKYKLSLGMKKRLIIGVNKLKIQSLLTGKDNKFPPDENYTITSDPESMVVEYTKPAKYLLIDNSVVIEKDSTVEVKVFEWCPIADSKTLSQT